MAHAKELGLPLVVTCDAHYLKHEDYDTLKSQVEDVCQIFAFGINNELHYSLNSL